MQTDEAPRQLHPRWRRRRRYPSAVPRLVGSAIVALAVLVAVLTIEAVHKNSRIDSLRHRGVPVDVTVTDCLGILSGTGVTVTYIPVQRVVRPRRPQLPRRHRAAPTSTINAGDVVKAVADPKHPTSVSSASSLVNAHSSWRTYIAPAAVRAVAAAGCRRTVVVATQLSPAPP